MSKTYQICYHVSPEASISLFKGKYSQKFKQKGLFVTPKYNSIGDDWISYVAHKKHPRTSVNTYDEKYRNLTLYSIKVPKKLISKCEKLYYDTYEKALKRAGKENESKLFGTWFWGPEYFIPEDDLNQIEIVGRKTHTYEDLFVKTSSGRKPNEDQDNSWYGFAKKACKNNYAARVCMLWHEELLKLRLLRIPAGLINPLRTDYHFSKINEFFSKKENGSWKYYPDNRNLTKQELSEVEKIHNLLQQRYADIQYNLKHYYPLDFFNTHSISRSGCIQNCVTTIRSGSQVIHLLSYSENMNYYSGYTRLKSISKYECKYCNQTLEFKK